MDGTSLKTEMKLSNKKQSLSHFLGAPLRVILDRMQLG